MYNIFMQDDRSRFGAQRGHLHEEKFKLRALEQGYEVFDSRAAHSRIDTILVLGPKIQRVQIKTATLCDGILKFESSTKTYNTTTKKYSSNVCYTEEEIDAFGLYCPQTDEYFLIPIVYCKDRLKTRLVYEQGQSPCIGCLPAHPFLF
jgi:hypothetical protein